MNARTQDLWDEPPDNWKNRLTPYHKVPLNQPDGKF
jgi:hypothetical protein